MKTAPIVAARIEPSAEGLPYSPTFADVYRDIGSFKVEPGSSFRRWVLSIMLNRVADLHRRDMARKRRADGLVPIDAGDESGAGGVQVADEHSHRASMLARYQEVRADFLAALDQLDGEKRTIIELHVLNGLTFEEIADKVGRNKAVTVRAIYNRAMQKIRTELARHA